MNIVNDYDYIIRCDQMNIELAGEIKKLELLFPEYGFSARKVGGFGPIWGSIFIVDKEDGVSCGRLIYMNYKFSHRKAYGEKHGFPINSFFHRYDIWKETGVLVDKEYIDIAKDKAKAVRIKRLRILEDIRDAMPIKYKKKLDKDGNKVIQMRKRLQGPDVERVMMQIIGVVPMSETLQPLIEEVLGE